MAIGKRPGYNNSSIQTLLITKHKELTIKHIFDDAFTPLL